MTGPTTVSEARSADLTLARLHLRLGSLAIARAELETLAGRDALDAAGLEDLAEARWRTGDVAGAGEVAGVILGDGLDGPLVVLVIASEAALVHGRPTEARRYATRAMELADGGIDAIFAGMPRGPVWPVDATTVSHPSPTLFDTLSARPGAAPAAGSAAAAAVHPADQPAVPTSPEPSTIALWDADAEAVEPPSDTLPEPVVVSGEGVSPGDHDVSAGDRIPVPVGDAALDLGRDALTAGDIETASVQLALVLRLTPALAPAVLDVVEGRPDRRLALVRGDAYRLVGREREAQRAFAEAGGLDPQPEPDIDQPTDPPQEGAPA
jgi:hypothetical protein